MAKKTKTKNEPLPIRKSSHIKEDNSNDIFRESIKPWMFRGAVEREYGLDGTVEITKPLSTAKDQIVTGKRFSVQLKSSDVRDFEQEEFSLSVPRDKINYWYGAVEPVLIVFIDLNSRRCFFRWIDEKLIDELFKSNPNWIAQETVSIKFKKDGTISPSSLLEVERYVLNWKRPSRTILTPGNYFKFSQEAKSFIELLANKIEHCNVNFLYSELQELKESILHTIYTVAIVGPNKAGKSTLINSLLQKTVSPVGLLPTTGIPISIFPGNKNKSIILFKDNTQIEGSIEELFLREYTAKDNNPNNEKGVKIVSVEVVNSLLEKGFAICDVPGLDDPDGEIRQITKTALYNANAIIYVISVGSIITGDFSLTKQIIDDLKELGGRMDRLFLVFNKTDALSEEQLIVLKKYVDSELKKFQIDKYLPTAPMYISSLDSFINRIENRNTDDSVGMLENEMWEYLLSQNKTGLHKIIGTFGDSLELIDKLKKIITSRLLDTDKRKNLEERIREVSIEIGGLRTIVSENRQRIFKGLREYLDSSFTNILIYLQEDMDSVPIGTPLPTNAQITAWLEENAYESISEVYDDLQQQMYVLQSTINQWIYEKLNFIGIESSDEFISSKMPEINLYTNQIRTHYHDKKTNYTGILESFVETLAELLVNLLDGAIDLLTTNAKKRAAQKKSIFQKAKRSYKRIFDDCVANLSNYLNNICRNMEEKSIDRANVYLGELSAQIAKLDQPISSVESKNFECFMEEVKQIENGIQSNLTHLQSYTDGIRRK